MYIDLDTVKKHLNIEPDFTADDEYILGLLGVAEEAVRVHVNEDFGTLAEANGGCLPAPILQACLLMIGNLYQHREPINKNGIELPLSYTYLIRLYQNWD